MSTRPPVFSHPLQNQWFCLRHGQSSANVSQTIASDPATAIDDFGLTDSGRQQITSTITNQSVLASTTRIIASDFLRTRQSAELAGLILNSSKLSFNPLLRERWFGQWDNKDALHYHDVWALDKHNPHHTESGVESVAAVALRIGTLIEQMESTFYNETFLLVSHGDTLQILECLFCDQSIANHRELPPLATAELRTLHLR